MNYLKQVSYIKTIKEFQNSFFIEFDFYSALKWSASTILSTQRGDANIQTVEIQSHSKLFTILWLGDLKGKVDTRIHYMCETSEVFDSIHCDCKQQKDQFLDHIFKQKSGLFIYAHEEGRNLGLTNKILAYEDTLKNKTSTYQAMINVAGKSEARMFEIPADIIYQLGIKEILLWTNNPLKINPVKYRGIKVNKKSFWAKNTSKKAHKYIQEKIKEMNHIA